MVTDDFRDTFEWRYDPLTDNPKIQCDKWTEELKDSTVVKSFEMYSSVAPDMTYTLPVVECLY